MTEFVFEDEEVFDTVEIYNPQTDVQVKISDSNGTETIAASRSMRVSSFLQYLRDKYDVGSKDTFRVFEVGVGEIRMCADVCKTLFERFGARFVLRIDIERYVDRFLTEQQLCDHLVKMLGSDYIARSGMHVPTNLLVTIRELATFFTFDEIADMFEEVGIDLSNEGGLPWVHRIFASITNEQLRKKLELFVTDQRMASNRQIDSLTSELGVVAVDSLRDMTEETFVALLGREEYERQCRIYRTHSRR
jgi:hypothetical protein